MSIATSCRVCAYSITIAETAPRLCPRCLGQPEKTRETLELRVIEQEEALARAYAAFIRVVDTVSLETLLRYEAVITARYKCALDEERWATQRHREALTVAKGDELAGILLAEQKLNDQAVIISAQMDSLHDAIWDLDAAAGGTYMWEPSAHAIARRRALPALRVPGQPQLLAIRVLDPRPTVEPVAAPAPAPARSAAPPRPISRCEECDMPIVWGRTANNKPCPYDADDQGNKTEVSHFSTCTNPKRFSKAKPATKKAAPKVAPKAVAA